MKTINEIMQEALNNRIGQRAILAKGVKSVIKGYDPEYKPGAIFRSDEARKAVRY